VQHTRYGLIHALVLHNLRWCCIGTVKTSLLAGKTMKYRLAISALLCLLTITLAIAKNPVTDTRIHDADVQQMQAWMQEGTLNARRLTAYYLDRIKRLDNPLHSIIRINPDALSIADALDAERASRGSRGPLHGIPVLLKDNIETRDRMPTTAGSLALAENVTRRDGAMVARLRAAGAIILGKANLSEWANFRSERSSSGWSGVGGQTHNPYDLSRSPCGSSSGSGVAAAAGLAALAIGTETDGSVVCPASVNGIVGVKPSIGLVGRSGIVPLSHNQDTAGPMARSVSDAAILLTVMAGPDPHDAMSSRGKAFFGHNYAEDLRTDGLEGKRIGVLRSNAGFHEAVDALFEQALLDLKQAGAIIVDGLKLENPKGFSKASYDVLLFDFKHDINQYLSGLPNGLSSLTLEKLIAFNQAHAGVEMPYFRQEIFIKAQAKEDLSDPEYTKALALVHLATRQDGIDHLLQAHKLDLLVAPTLSPAWSIDLVNGDHFLGGTSSLPAISGYPHITVPMGDVHGLPVGLSLFSGAFSEPVLFQAAYDYEQATHHRHFPKGY